MTPYVNGLSGDGAIAVRGADGPEVLIQYYTDAAHYRRLLRSTVNSIVGDLDGGRIPPGSVAILTTERGFLPAELWEPGFFIRPVREAGLGASGSEIRVATVHAFKGLEASCVVLVGLSELDTPSSRRMMYVGGSRAKSVLRVLLPQAASATVVRSLPRIFEAIQHASRAAGLATE